MITALNPKWIAKSTSEKLSSNNSLSVVLDFFLLRSPCNYQSNRKFDISKLWGIAPWTVERNLKKPLNITLFGSASPNLVKCKKNEMQDKANEYDLNDDFYNNLNRQVCIFVEAPYPGNSNQYMSFFYHIRNALAHSRFAIIENLDGYDMFVFEDGKWASNTEFEVNARGIIELDRLVKVVRLLETGPKNLPKEEELILSAIESGKRKRKAKCDLLEISSSDWRTYIGILKAEGKVVHSKKEGWKINPGQ